MLRRSFITGLAAGIFAPLIVPRSSLMAMPRAPLIMPSPVFGLTFIEKPNPVTEGWELKLQYFDLVTKTWETVEGLAKVPGLAPVRFIDPSPKLEVTFKLEHFDDSVMQVRPIK